MMTPEINLPAPKEESAKFIMELIINEEGDFHVGDSQP